MYSRGQSIFSGVLTLVFYDDSTQKGQCCFHRTSEMNANRQAARSRLFRTYYSGEGARADDTIILFSFSFGDECERRCKFFTRSHSDMSPWRYPMKQYEHIKHDSSRELICTRMGLLCPLPKCKFPLPLLHVSVLTPTQTGRRPSSATRFRVGIVLMVGRRFGRFGRRAGGRRVLVL